MADDRRQHLLDMTIAVVAHAPTSEKLGATAERLADALLPLLDQVAANAAAGALESAANGATDAWVTWSYSPEGEWAMSASTLRARAAELRAPARTDEEN